MSVEEPDLPAVPETSREAESRDEDPCDAYKSGASHQLRGTVRFEDEQQLIKKLQEIQINQRKQEVTALTAFLR